MNKEIKEEQPNYYAIIPADVRYSKNIVPQAKLLYGEITSLTNKKGWCWAKNSYFASLYDVKEPTISVWISSLIKNGFLTAEYTQVYDRELERFVRSRRLYVTERKKEEKKEELEEENNEKSVSKNQKRHSKSVSKNQKYNNKYNTNNTEEILSESSFNKLKLSSSRISSTPSEVHPISSEKGLFNSEQKTQPNKRNPFTPTEQALLKIIEKIVADKDLYFNHKLPNKENNYKTTVLIKKTLVYMQHLLKGDLLDSILINDEKIKAYNLTVLHEPQTLDMLEAMIEQAIERWKLKFTIGYEPRNKEHIKKVSLDNWFYNERNQFSWFLECLNESPKSVRVRNIEDIKKSLPERFLHWFDKLYQYFDFTEEEYAIYYMGLQEIYHKFENLALIYDEFTYLNNWKFYLATPETFAKSMYFFLRDYPFANNVKILNAHSAMWDAWRKHALQMWHVDMSPTNKVIERMKKEDDQKRIDAVRHERKMKEQAKREKQLEEEKYLAELLD
jgi:hypothetical protein